MAHIGITPTTISARTPSLLEYLNPFNLIRNLWRYRDLIFQFTRREIESRYRGSFLGSFWTFVYPLVQLLIYTFVFGVIFKSRWPQARTTSLGEFATIIFCGITFFNIFSECINRAPRLILGVPNYVKKVVFPLEILPVSVLGSALFHSLISVGILLTAAFVVNGRLYWTLVLLPLVIIPLLFLSLGLSWLLASLGVFIRDVSQLVGLGVQILFFTSAIFYSTERIPQPYRAMIFLNPLTPIVENSRRVILWGVLPSWRGLILWILATGVVMLSGYAFFMKTKKAFSDVI